MDTLKERLQNISGGRILDVGTGAGYFIRTFKEYFKDYSEIIGIDSNDRALTIARDNYKDENVQFIKMDAAKMGFEDESMDTVAISNTLHHLPDMDQVLREMKRVLRKGGHFIVAEMFCDNQSAKQLSHVKLHHLAGELDTALGVCHDRTFSKDEIVDIVKSIELDIVDTFLYNTYEEQNGQRTPEEEKDAIDMWINGISKRLEENRDIHQYEAIKTELEELKSSLYDVGFMVATSVMVIGKK